MMLWFAIGLLVVSGGSAAILLWACFRAPEIEECDCEMCRRQRWERYFGSYRVDERTSGETDETEPLASDRPPGRPRHPRRQIVRIDHRQPAFELRRDPV